MEELKQRNMLIIKNLPSNIIKEAIVVMKSPQKVKELNNIQKNMLVIKNKKEKKAGNEKEYILKEVENVITEYIDELEEKNNKLKREKKMSRLKTYSYFLTAIAIIQFVIILVN